MSKRLITLNHEKILISIVSIVILTISIGITHGLIPLDTTKGVYLRIPYLCIAGDYTPASLLSLVKNPTVKTNSLYLLTFKNGATFIGSFPTLSSASDYVTTVNAQGQVTSVGGIATTNTGATVSTYNTATAPPASSYNPTTGQNNVIAGGTTPSSASTTYSPSSNSISSNTVVNAIGLKAIPDPNGNGFIYVPVNTGTICVAPTVIQPYANYQAQKQQLSNIPSTSTPNASPTVLGVPVTQVAGTCGFFENCNYYTPSEKVGGGNIATNSGVPTNSPTNTPVTPDPTSSVCFATTSPFIVNCGVPKTTSPPSTSTSSSSSGNTSSNITIPPPSNNGCPSGQLKSPLGCVDPNNPPTCQQGLTWNTVILECINSNTVLPIGVGANNGTNSGATAFINPLPIYQGQSQLSGTNGQNLATSCQPPYVVTQIFSDHVVCSTPPTSFNLNFLTNGYMPYIIVFGIVMIIGLIVIFNAKTKR